MVRPARPGPGRPKGRSDRGDGGWRIRGRDPGGNWAVHYLPAVCQLRCPGRPHRRHVVTTAKVVTIHTIDAEPTAEKASAERAGWKRWLTSAWSSRKKEEADAAP